MDSVLGYREDNEMSTQECKLIFCQKLIVIELYRETSSGLFIFGFRNSPHYSLSIQANSSTLNFHSTLKALLGYMIL